MIPLPPEQIETSRHLIVLRGERTTVHLRVQPTTPSGQSGAGDFWLDVRVSTREFAGGNAGIWLGAENWRAFLAELRDLDARRSGGAGIQAMSPNDFELRVEVYDHAGHVRIAGHLGADVVLQDRTDVARIPFRIELAPDSLPDLSASFGQLASGP